MFDQIFSSTGWAQAVLWCYINQSAGVLIHNPVIHARTEHIEIDVHFIQVAQQFKVCYVPNPD